MPSPGGVRLEGIVKRHGATTVLHGIDLTIEPGEFFVLLGPSGSGKTTTLRILAGLESVSSGRVLMDGARPEPLGGCTVRQLNDQHAFVDLDAPDRLAVGDLVALGISHPCTTFDKWRLIPVVDGDHRIEDCVHTFF